MGKKRITSYSHIEDKVCRTVTYNKRKRGLLKKAMELSHLCSQQVLVAIYNNQNHKLVLYQSTPDFSPTKVNHLLASNITKSNLYEEHSNVDFNSKGSKKLQAFNFRLGNKDPLPYRGQKPREKRHWKIVNKTAKYVEEENVEEDSDSNDSDDEEDQ